MAVHGPGSEVHEIGHFGCLGCCKLLWQGQWLMVVISSAPLATSRAIKRLGHSSHMIPQANPGQTLEHRHGCQALDHFHLWGDNCLPIITSGKPCPTWIALLQILTPEEQLRCSPAHVRAGRDIGGWVFVKKTLCHPSRSGPPYEP